MEQKIVVIGVRKNIVILIVGRNSICLCGLKPGMMVRVMHANFMTFSIPPQTTALQVQIL